MHEIYSITKGLNQSEDSMNEGILVSSLNFMVWNNSIMLN